MAQRTRRDDFPLVESLRTTAVRILQHSPRWQWPREPARARFVLVRLASARAPLEDIDSQFHHITGEQSSPTDGRFWTQYGTGGSAVGSRAAPESCLAGAVGTLFLHL